MSEAYPHSPTTEEALLHCFLIDAEQLGHIDVQPEDFYIERNRWIFQAMTDLRRGGVEVNYVTICAKLDERGQLGELGGQNRVVQLLTMPDIYVFHAESYAHILRSKTMRRRILDASRDLALLSGKDDDRAVESGIGAVMDTLARLATSEAGAAHISKFLSELYDEVQKANENPMDIYGIPTGLGDFDRASGGLQRGEVMKLAGEPGIGKSALACQLGVGMAKNQHPGVIYALEMKGRNIARRMIAAASKVPTQAMKTGKMSEAQWLDFTSAVSTTEKLPIYLSDSSTWTTAAMRADMNRLKTQYGIEWAILDYEGLLLDDQDKDETTRSKIVSGRVHGMFKDLNIAGLVVDDLNKAGFGENGGKANLSGSARKIYDADSIVFMRQHKTVVDWVSLTWEKNREGDPNQFIDLRRTKGYPAFIETTQREAR